LDRLVSKSPKTAFVKTQNQPLFIDQIEIGTVLQVKPGEMIPMDGILVSGESSVDEAMITGESIPQDKHKGDNLFAGTLNKSGFIEMETTRRAEDTTFSKIIRLTFEAQANKSEAQQFIQKFSSYYTPSMILLALAIFVIPVFVMHLDQQVWMEQAITILVIACPCALVISTPVAIYAAIGNASSRGALVKGGKHMEALADIKAIALDKTRTITFGQPIVSDIYPLNGTDREELLACTAGAEMFSEHPLAQAIVDASRREGLEPHLTDRFHSVLGKGAIARCLVCEDESIYVGKLEFIKEYQPIDEAAERIVRQLAAEGKTSVVVSFGNGVAGVIGLMDEIKPDSIEAIKEIREMNIVPIILTGDHIRAAQFVAEQVGIKHVFGDLLPEEKSEKIKELLSQ
jgi:Cd2+/Zn2+-exporting ATPase